MSPLKPVTPVESTADQSSRLPDQIATLLRNLIISGHYGPGDRLPTRRDLEKQLDVGRVTLQTALHRLREEGFVSPHGRNGTFVTQTPPHLFRYAMVFFQLPQDRGNWGLMHRGMERAAEELELQSPYTIDRLLVTPDIQSLERFNTLFQEAQNNLLAGIIFVRCLHNLPEGAIENTPCVSIDVGPHQGPVLGFDVQSFADTSVACLAGQGCKRIALLHESSNVHYDHLCDLFRSPMEKAGLAIKRRWVQAVSPLSPEWSHNILEMMFHPDQNERPDGLIIIDDNLVTEATKALKTLNLRVPEDLKVVTHANFPWVPESMVPVERIGLDIRALMSRCFSLMDQQRRGKTPEVMHELLRAVTQDDCFPHIMVPSPL